MNYTERCNLIESIFQEKTKKIHEFFEMYCFFEKERDAIFFENDKLFTYQIHDDLYSYSRIIINVHFDYSDFALSSEFKIQTNESFSKFSIYEILSGGNKSHIKKIELFLHEVNEFISVYEEKLKIIDDKLLLANSVKELDEKNNDKFLKG